MLVALLLIVVAGVAFFFGRMSKSINVIEVSDVFTPNPARSETQQAQDAIMQLKNEIAKTGALKITTYADCKKATLKIVLN